MSMHPRECSLACSRRVCNPSMFPCRIAIGVGRCHRDRPALVAAARQRAEAARTDAPSWPHAAQRRQRDDEN